MTDAQAQAKGIPSTGRLSIGAGLLLLAVLTVLWGVNWPMMKLAVAEVPVWTFRRDRASASRAVRCGRC
jgi:hypothetical protein